MVSFMVVITDYRKYLVDLSLRISGYTTHLLLALNMALNFVLKHLAIFYSTSTEPKLKSRSKRQIP